MLSMSLPISTSSPKLSNKLIKMLSYFLQDDLNAWQDLIRLCFKHLETSCRYEFHNNPKKLFKNIFKHRVNQECQKLKITPAQLLVILSGNLEVIGQLNPLIRKDPLYMLAANAGHTAAVAKIKNRNNLPLIFHQAGVRGHVNVLLQINKFKPRIIVNDKTITATFTEAAGNGHENVVKYILQHYPINDKSLQIAIEKALKEGFFGVVKTIVEFKAHDKLWLAHALTIGVEKSSAASLIHFLNSMGLEKYRYIIVLAFNNAVHVGKPLIVRKLLKLGMLSLQDKMAARDVAIKNSYHEIVSILHEDLQNLILDLGDNLLEIQNSREEKCLSESKGACLLPQFQLLKVSQITTEPATGPALVEERCKNRVKIIH